MKIHQESLSQLDDFITVVKILLNPPPHTHTPNTTFRKTTAQERALYCMCPNPSPPGPLKRFLCIFYKASSSRLSRQLLHHYYSPGSVFPQEA